MCISGGRVATRFHLRLADGGRVAQFRGLGVHLKTQRVAVASAREGSPLRMTLVSWFLFFSSFFLCLAEKKRIIYEESALIPLCENGG